MIETVSSIAEIENLYKLGSNAPYTKLDKGYLGVLLVHKTTGEVCCHVCGKWYANLGRHTPTHNLTPDEYKLHYGFPRTQPLCSPHLSAIRSEQTRNRIADGSLVPKPFTTDNNKTHGFRKGLAGRRSASFENKNAICDEQVVHRVLGIAERTGEILNSSLIHREDAALSSIIFSRYGSWREFVKQNGLQIRVQDRKQQVEPRTSNAVILDQIRRVATLEGFIPTSKSWVQSAKKYGYVSSNTIYSRFGSWNRALHNAGLFHPEK